MLMLGAQAFEMSG